MTIMRTRDEAFCVIGDASNVLFDSAGFRGVVMRIGRRMSAIDIRDDLVTAQAGVAVPELAWRAGRAGLTGIEHTVGIPGSLGGLVLMNGGSLRQGIGSHVETIVCVDPGGEVVEMTGEDCEFTYRSSKLQGSGLAVVEARLRLTRGDPVESVQTMESILASRAARFPMDVPSCGSTFVSNPAMYESLGTPGHAIEAVGLKGARRGGAQISDLHANFFVNTGGATSDDMLWLIALARNSVRHSTGFDMDCEVRYVAPNGAVGPAHEAALERWGANLILGSVGQ
jgi:UDP-N-acetylmuramate dehydrogenase